MVAVAFEVGVGAGGASSEGLSDGVIVVTDAVADCVVGVVVGAVAFEACVGAG